MRHSQHDLYINICIFMYAQMPDKNEPNFQHLCFRYWRSEEHELIFLSKHLIIQLTLDPTILIILVPTLHVSMVPPFWVYPAMTPFLAGEQKPEEFLPACSSVGNWQGRKNLVWGLAMLPLDKKYESSLRLSRGDTYRQHQQADCLPINLKSPFTSELHPCNKIKENPKSY